MKDLAKFLVRAKVKPRLQRKDPPPALPNGSDQASVYSPLDSWRPSARRESLLPEIPTPTPTSPPPVNRIDTKPPNRTADPPPVEGTKVRAAKRASPDKRRRNALSISVSEEEAELVYSYLRERDMALSSWVRGLMFKAMGRKLPARPKRYGMTGSEEEEN